MKLIVNDETFSRTAMALCLGTSVVVLLTHWWTGARKPQLAEPKKDATVAAVVGQPVTRQLPVERRSPGTWQRLTQPFAISQPDPPVTSETSRLVVDLSDRRVYIYRSEKLVDQYSIAVGQAGWETPTGDFQVERMQRNPSWRHPITGEVVPTGDRNPLGRHWIGFWSSDRTQIGFHGTNREELVGQAVSHGCLRMRNQDVEALYRQVRVGTPVTVRP
jgi:lipoprotein-anchoring transpeptidase ErfK/SrfK